MLHWALKGVGLALVWGALQAAELYRWQEGGSGAVVFSDRLPPEKVKDAHTVYNPQGREVRSLPPELTSEQREALRREQAMREQAEREARMQAERDAMLLKLYASEAAIHEAREARLAALDSQRAVLAHQLEDQRARLAVLGSHPADQIEAQELRRRIAEKEQALLRLQQERLRTVESFARDMERWRALKTASSTTPPIAPRTRLNP